MPAHFHSWRRTLLSLAFLAATAAAAWGGVYWTASLCLLLGILFAVRWPTMTGLPQPHGVGVLLGAVAAAGVVMIFSTPGPSFMRRIPLVVALGLMALWIQQLSRVGQPHKIRSLLVGSFGVLVSVFGGAWLAMKLSTPGVSFFKVAIATAVCVVLPGLLSATAAGYAAAVALAGALATGLSWWLWGVHPLAGGALALLCGTAAACIHILGGHSPFKHRLLDDAALAFMPVAATGVFAYMVERAFG